MKIRRSDDHLISTMGFPILIRRHLYTELGIWSWTGDKPLPEPMMIQFTMTYDITSPKCGKISHIVEISQFNHEGHVNPHLEHFNWAMSMHPTGGPWPADRGTIAIYILICFANPGKHLAKPCVGLLFLWQPTWPFRKGILTRTHAKIYDEISLAILSDYIKNHLK